jgi:hypothetical protein
VPPSRVRTVALRARIGGLRNRFFFRPKQTVTNRVAITRPITNCHYAPLARPVFHFEMMHRDNLPGILRPWVANARIVIDLPIHTDFDVTFRRWGLLPQLRNSAIVLPLEISAWVMLKDGIRVAEITGVTV